MFDLPPPAILDFKGYLLQDLDVQKQCYHVGERSTKIDSTAPEIFNVISLFRQVYYFSEVHKVD